MRFLDLHGEDRYKLCFLGGAVCEQAGCDCTVCQAHDPEHLCLMEDEFWEQATPEVSPRWLELLASDPHSHFYREARRE